MSYIDDLGRELRLHGIRGQRRCRILAEVIDHLDEDQGAQERFGSPREVANAFAAELGAQASRRAAVAGFAALGVAGLVYGSAFITLGFAGPPTEAFGPALGALAFGTMIVAPQVAFVAGALALVRALRRRATVLPTEELAIIKRRTAVALAFGLVTMGALALYAFEYRAMLADWWLTFTYVSTAAASSLLCASFVPTLRAAQLRPQVAGDAGDVFDDFGIERLRREPWRFAQLVALAVGVAVWAAGIAHGDPFDGLLRGVLEGLACFGGFAALGRYLGLRR
jgi:hypothetical protein